MNSSSILPTLYSIRFIFPNFNQWVHYLAKHGSHGKNPRDSVTSSAHLSSANWCWPAQGNVAGTNQQWWLVTSSVTAN